MWVRNEGESTLSKIDPIALVEVSRVDVGARPVAFAKAGGRLWVATDDGGLWRIDAAMIAADRFELGRTPVALAGFEDEMWVAATDGSILRIEAAA
jgi:ligand-binding sensor domain-containing protein